MPDRCDIYAVESGAEMVEILRHEQEAFEDFWSENKCFDSGRLDVDFYRITPEKGAEIAAKYDRIGDCSQMSRYLGEYTAGDAPPWMLDVRGLTEAEYAAEVDFV